MGTVIPRKRRDGSTAYQAQLLIKRGGKIVHREGRTFDCKQAAAAWLENRETELAKSNAPERIRAVDPTLASVIDQYTEESIKHIGRTKAQVLRLHSHTWIGSPGSASAYLAGRMPAKWSQRYFSSGYLYRDPTIQLVVKGCVPGPQDEPRGPVTINH